MLGTATVVTPITIAVIPTAVDAHDTDSLQ